MKFELPLLAVQDVEVSKKFYKGLSVEEVTEIIQHPVEFVQQCL